ncbi:MAG: hypothetical protein WBD83_13895, partial [Xanthobacteraceae bacterium]
MLDGRRGAGVSGGGLGSQVDVGRCGAGEPRNVANGGRGNPAPRSGDVSAGTAAADEACVAALGDAAAAVSP